MINRDGKQPDPGLLMEEPDEDYERGWRPVETRHAPILEDPGTVLVEEVADGQHVAFHRLPQEHPLIQALTADPATFVRRERPRRTDAETADGVMAWLDRETE